MANNKLGKLQQIFDRSKSVQNKEICGTTWEKLAKDRNSQVKSKKPSLRNNQEN